METKKKQISELLSAGERLTVKTTWQKVNTTELRYYVALLRKEGMPINSRWISTENLRYKEYYV